MAVVVLSIAGSDPSGGAGIQADLKTFQAFGVFGAAVVTSLTAQNTTGVRDRRDVAADFVGAQLDAVLDDLPVAAAKTGMLPTAAIVDAVARRFAERPLPALVVDPVLVATSGDALAEAAALPRLRDALVPLATLVTPNLAEAEALTGRRTRTVPEMRDTARALLDLGARAALVTGGHLPDRAVDVLATRDGLHELDAARVAVGPTHGTGCTLSAAIAACLASGVPLVTAVERAKRYVTRALAAAVPIGAGSRPLDHRVRPDDS
jgi:hydroxymethylpyrimidine kinase/phosphomethylpyrimidine kinase